MILTILIYIKYIYDHIKKISGHFDDYEMGDDLIRSHCGELSMGK